MLSAMGNSSHYTTEDYEFLSVSNNTLDRIHNYVDVCKGMIRTGLDTYGRTRNFTFAVRKGRVVEIGWNNHRRVVNFIPRLGNLKYYSPIEHRESQYVPSLHSEMACLKKIGNGIALEDFRSYDIVNIRINRTDAMNCVLSAPCCNCRQAMRTLQIGKIYFYDGCEWKCIRGH